ncbi:ATP-dependent DNA helicase PIF1-like protein [Tanacetum coccineum]
MLLNVARGPQGFKELMTVNNRLYPTFKAACFAYGLLNDDKEWAHAISEAAFWALAPQLRNLFVTISAMGTNLGTLIRGYSPKEANGRSLTDFQELPQLNSAFLTHMDNRLIREALDFDIKKVPPFIILPLCFNIRGRTTHSRFVIPLELMENSTCGIKQNTNLVELIQQVHVIIWDEAPMTQKYTFEVLDRTLRDILEYKNPEKRNSIFGGVTVLLGGDFRQILLVIPKGKRAKIVQACINRSKLWKSCPKCRGRDCGRQKKEDEDETTWIEILEYFIINAVKSPIEQIVKERFPDFTTKKSNGAYLKERAILTPKNDDADVINAYMFKKLPGPTVTYNNADEVCKASSDVLDQKHLYPVEFLNSLNFPGMPPHALNLKKELPIMLLRNVNPGPRVVCYSGLNPN